MASTSPHFTFNNLSRQLNVAFILVKPKTRYYNSIMQQNTTMAIIAITISSLLNALQIKYQPPSASPFQAHPITMTIAISSLLIYCFGCDSEHYFSSICGFSWRRTLIYINILRSLGFISVASFASIIFSSSAMSSMIIYLIFALFFSARLIVSWIQNKTLLENRGGYSYSDMQTHINVPSIYVFCHHRDNLPV